MKKETIVLKDNKCAVCKSLINECSNCKYSQPLIKYGIPGNEDNFKLREGFKLSKDGKYYFKVYEDDKIESKVIMRNNTLRIVEKPKLIKREGVKRKVKAKAKVNDVAELSPVHTVESKVEKINRKEKKGVRIMSKKVKKTAKVAKVKTCEKLETCNLGRFKGKHKVCAECLANNYSRFKPVDRKPKSKPEVKEIVKKRGRPVGSKNRKSKPEIRETVKKRGRPVGSKNKPVKETAKNSTAKVNGNGGKWTTKYDTNCVYCGGIVKKGTGKLWRYKGRYYAAHEGCNKNNRTTKPYNDNKVNNKVNNGNRRVNKKAEKRNWLIRKLSAIWSA